MSATDELRRLLDERGVPYETNDDMGASETRWDGFTAYQLTPNAKLIMHPTPEQAIAATQPRKDNSCVECAKGMGRYADSLCDPLKQRIAELEEQRDVLLRCLENDYGIRASWDGLRRVWLTESVTAELDYIEDNRHRY